MNILDVLPWEDVLFRHVFPALPLDTMFQLRAVSQQYLECVTLYFCHTYTVNLTQAGKGFNQSTFHIMTHNNCVLRTLILRHAKDWLSDICLLPVLAANPKLTKVDLTCCTSLSNASVQKLTVSSKHNLRELYLRDCHWLSPDGVLVIAFNCPQLQKLDITGCWQVDDKSVVALVSFCHQIRFLSVSKIYGLTDHSMTAIAKQCSKLRHLNMQGCWRITDDAVRLLGEYCKELRMLQVRECREVTMYSIARLRARGVRVDVPNKPYQVNPELARYLQNIHLQV